MEKTEAKEFLRALEIARLEVKEALTALERHDTFTALQYRSVVPDIEMAILRLRQRLHSLSELRVTEAQNVAKSHVLELSALDKTLEPSRLLVNSAVTMRLSQANELIATLSQMDKLSQDLLTSVNRSVVAGIARRASYRDIVNSVLAKQSRTSPFYRSRSRVELSVRMMMNAAYNEAHQVALEETGAVIGSVMKMADEAIDARNHPLSRALHGKVAELNEPFRVPVGEVHQHAKAMGKSVGGILWPIIDGHYVGTYPAHYNERGRQVPYRPEWT